ncbi:MAG: hypothetical protein Q8W51_11820 [Candidatus Palauibacterales bacterium]|nr:hypothetical protein [Candidatus Palauibacterales bacterium]MDP2530408.1 hypothetical protein [Candidatus Palauibacterales bacterium]MDP2585094.1 hypothetical protein [Candidatus Palauibacterales bacterium]
MKPFMPGLIALTLPLVLAGPSLAQQEDAPTAFVSGTYYQCDQSSSPRASEIVRTVVWPVVQKHIAAGQVSGFGLLAHHTGGPWRRAIYYVGTDLPKLLAAQDSIVAELMANHAKETHELMSICPSHDDYIWSYVAASQPATDVATARPAFAFSTYQVCHEATEGLGDEVMKALYAPIYDKQVKAGRLHSWGYYSHFVGGKYRRLLALDGPSYNSILAARDSIIAETQAKYPQISAAVATVCDGHTDYMWDIEMSKP